MILDSSELICYQQISHIALNSIYMFFLYIYKQLYMFYTQLIEFSLSISAFAVIKSTGLGNHTTTHRLLGFLFLPIFYCHADHKLPQVFYFVPYHKHLRNKVYESFYNSILKVGLNVLARRQFFTVIFYH